jgi:two-component system NarL family sensor kinase
VSQRSGIEIQLQVQANSLGRLKSEVETAIFRIVQEALTNMFRHSGARHGCIAVAAENGNVLVTVSDDGKGIDEDVIQFRPESVGVGIGGMRQRVTELGGTLRLVNANPGTVVEVVIPVGKPHQSNQVPVSA